MKSWLFSVVVLFILAKTFLWFRGFILPVPIYVLAGAFLAIASNYDKGIMNLFRPEATETNDVISQTASLVEEVAMLESKD
ncbi:conserved hypothetical protein [Hyella patelloides LEGE 07179]|uniref:Uncharacterized protein n=1 Tax=Hyella patelloides LEGE 07179 TaxID=945734 RepID=A0A563VJJ3_9CYAN|nr:hypothetical protein [Hyella patelloides]VEP11571.1 conserved hypothetical protein [Hyella patelloides LEGE 07179]